MIIVRVLIVAVVIIIVIADFIFSYAPGEEFSLRRKSLIAVLVGMILLLVSGIFVIIPSGSAGVKITLGQIDSASVHPGINLKIPIVQTVQIVNTKQQDITFDQEIWSETSERTAIYYDNVTVTYQINASSAAWILTNVTDYKDSLINHNIVSSAIKASSKTLSDTDATSRAKIEPLTLLSLQASLDQKYGEDVIRITKVIIANADFEDSYKEAIAAKQNALLEAEKQSIENQRAKEKAEADAAIKKTTSQAEADAKLIAAQAEADSIRIIAQAEAESNELLSKSITDPVLRDKWLNVWDGQLPQSVIGDDAYASVLVGQ